MGHNRREIVVWVYSQNPDEAHSTAVGLTFSRPHSIFAMRSGREACKKWDRSTVKECHLAT